MMGLEAGCVFVSFSQTELHYLLVFISIISTSQIIPQIPHKARRAHHHPCFFHFGYFFLLTTK